MIQERLHTIDDNPGINTLPGTGYDVEGDLQFFKATTEKEGIYSAAHALSENITAYWNEYLVRQPVLPIRIAFNEDQEIIAPKFGNKRLIDTVSSDERNGAVYNSTCETVSFLRSAKPGNLVVWTSPPGDAGWTTRSGERVSYPETQTYIYSVDKNGVLQANTVITEMSLFQNERFLENLGEIKVKGVEKVTGTVLKFDKGVSVSDVIDAMEEVRESKFARGIVTFNEIREMLSNSTSLGARDENVERIICDFEKWVVRHGVSINTDDLQVKLTKTVLEVSAYMKAKNTNIEYQQSEYNLSEAFSYMQSLSGCAGGGGLTGYDYGIMDSPFGARYYSLLETRYLCCKCPFCKKEVMAEIYDLKIHCPKCKEEALWNE